MPRQRPHSIMRLEIPALASATSLSPVEQGDAARKAAEDILIVGESENTRRLIKTRCDLVLLGDSKVREAARPDPFSPHVVQFIVDRTALLKAGELIIELPRRLIGSSPFRLYRSKTNQSEGHSRINRPDKPLRGLPGQAITDWLTRSGGDRRTDLPATLERYGRAGTRPCCHCFYRKASGRPCWVNFRSAATHESCLYCFPKSYTWTIIFGQSFQKPYVIEDMPSELRGHLEPFLSAVMFAPESI